MSGNVVYRIKFPFCINSPCQVLFCLFQFLLMHTQPIRSIKSLQSLQLLGNANHADECRSNTTWTSNRCSRKPRPAALLLIHRLQCRTFGYVCLASCLFVFAEWYSICAQQNHLRCYEFFFEVNFFSTFLFQNFLKFLYHHI